MSNHTSASADQHGADSNGLNLPSFRDLVSFQSADAFADRYDARMPTQTHRGHSNVIALPRHPPEDSFEVIGVKRAGLHPSGSEVPPSLPHLVQQSRRGEWRQSSGEDHRDIPGSRAPVRDYHNDSPRHYRPREATYRDQHPDASYESRRESYRTGRQELDSAARQDRSMQEINGTSQTMVRSSKSQQATVFHPSSRMPNGGEQPYTSDLPGNVNNESRTLSTQAIPSQGSSRARGYLQPSQRTQSQSRHDDRHLESQRPSATASPRFQAPERQYHREHTSLDHLTERSQPASPRITQAGLCPAIAKPLHQITSPSLPTPRNQARMFDYSCARLPPESRIPSPSMNMGPPSSSMSAHRGPTSTIHQIDQARERVHGQQKALSQQQAQYAIERRAYQLRRSVYGNNPGGSSAFSCDKDSEMAIRTHHQSLERAKLERAEALPKGIPPVDRQSADLILHRDRRSLHADSSNPGYVHPTPPDQRGGYSIGPVKEHRLVDGRGTRIAVTDSPRAFHTRHEYEHTSRTLIRHRDDTHLPRSSSICHSRDLQGHRLLERERMEVEHMRAVQHQSSRAQHHSRNEVLRRQSVALEERSRAEHGIRSQARAQPQPQHMTAASSAFDRHDSRLVRASESSPAGGDRPITKKVAYPAEEGDPERRRESTYQREPIGVRPIFHRLGRSFDRAVEDVFPPRGRPSAEFERVDKAQVQYTMPRRAATPRQERSPPQASVNESNESYSGRQTPVTRMYWTQSPAQRPTRGNGDQHHRSSPQAPPLSGRGGEIVHPRNSQADNFRVASEQHLGYRDVQSASAHDAAVERDKLSHSNRAQPPVIASQHTGLPSHHALDQHLCVPTPTPSRPSKRHRADSDTSLVLKTSRFSVVAAEDDLSKPSSSRVVLPSPPRTSMQRESVQRLHPEQPETPSQPRPSNSSESPTKPINGSAPITPPLSSN